MVENPSSSDEVAAVAPPEPPRTRAPRQAAGSTPAKVTVQRTTEEADDEPTVPLEIIAEPTGSWPETRSVLARLGLEDHLGRPLPPQTEPAAGASTNGNGTPALESAAALNLAEPVPPFEDVVASTRVRPERQADVDWKGRGVLSGFFALRPGGGEAPARHPLAIGARRRTTAARFVRLAGALRPRPTAKRAASSEPRRRVVWRPETLRRWATAGLVSVILLGLAAAGVPAAVLSWRSALGTGPSPANVLGGGLALVGLALLAGGLIGLVIAERPAESSAEQATPPTFASLLLGRPGALLAALGVVVLLCAAVAAA